MSANFAATKFDGICGMGFREISVHDLPPLFDEIYKAHQLDQNSFSFYLAQNPDTETGSSLVLGGTNPKYHSTPFTYHDVIEKKYWTIQANGVKVGQKTVIGKFKAIVDTGSSVLVGSESIIDPLIEELDVDLAVDCDIIPTLPILKFMIGEIEYELTPQMYVNKVTLFGQTQCILGIMSLKFPPEWGDVMILGDTFIKAYYTHFDVENQRVGFAKAVPI